MEDILKKIGIYDFFGIWGAGAVILNYFIFTIMRIKRIHILWLLSHYETDFSTLFIFIFCVTAYFLGIILHEIGKIFYELKGKKYNIEKIDDITTINFSILKKIKKGKTFFCVLIHPIKYRQMVLFKQIYKFKHECSLDEMISYLKQNNLTRVVDKYHSLYGLNRGILVGLSIHLLFSCMMIFFVCNKSLCFIIFDIYAIYIFYTRTYRYYTSWIKNVFVQYDLHKKAEQQRGNKQNEPH